MSIEWVLGCSWATVVVDCCFRFDRETVGLVLGKKEKKRERDMMEVVCACHVRAEELFYFGFGFSLVIPHRWVLTMMDNMRE
jgi:hypothetical protein